MNSARFPAGAVGIDRVGLVSRPVCAECGVPLERPAAADARGNVYCGDHVDQARGETDE